MGTVHRTARVGLRVTSGQRRRLYGLLVAAGDVWAALIEMNRERLRRGGAPIVRYAALCRALTGCVDLGELDMVGARSVLRRYTAGWFESNRRKKRGERARYRRRRRRLFPIRWYHGTFRIDGDGRRVRIPTTRGCRPLWVRLARDLPYPVDQIRSITLVADAGRLWLDVTAAVPVGQHDLDATRVAGVDVGIIHPFVVASEREALVISGRAVRANRGASGRCPPTRQAPQPQSSEAQPAREPAVAQATCPATQAGGPASAAGPPSSSRRRQTGRGLGGRPQDRHVSDRRPPRHHRQRCGCGAQPAAAAMATHASHPGVAG